MRVRRASHPAFPIFNNINPQAALSSFISFPLPTLCIQKYSANINVLQNRYRHLREVSGVQNGAGAPGGLLLPVDNPQLLHGSAHVGGVGACAQRPRQVPRVQLLLHALLHPVPVQVQLTHRYMYRVRYNDCNNLVMQTL